ncbi:phosphotransferase [Phreatobacter sp. AB_2022a]|uniref:phosphotransferase n=1 Tax=Phreatobacter sp. AB_2022a TaxID=3003134 RepID=UPI0022874A73|nr:phosphotransferase [Phreatobacter sp. AB_2022a]MCZ0733512.1 phosphotransferase [Phreatobacter sp. AB_2022a]
MQGAEHLGELLDEAPPAVSLDEAVALARDHFGLVATARPLTGERDHNFQLTDAAGAVYVLKVVHPAEPPAVTDFQSRALMHVAAADPELATPRVVPPRGAGGGDVVWRVQGRSDRRVRCLTYLAGRPLHLTERSPAQRRRLGAFLARLDRALAGFRHPAEDHDLLWDLKKAARVRGLLAEIADAERRGLPERALDRFARHVLPVLPSLRVQVVHNDFNPHNVLASAEADDEIAGVIDFGDMVRAPLIQDLATAAAYQVTGDGHPLQGVAEMAQAFHQVLPLADEEIAVLPELVATRLALTIAISSWRAARHPDNAPYILRNQAAAWTGLGRLDALDRDAAVTFLREAIAKDTLP